jgi:hypothetical protein
MNTDRKIQISSPRLQRNFKLQTAKSCPVWNLDFGASLELGAWSLELFPA